MSQPTTLYDKIWNDHLVHEAEDGTCLLYIDRHLVHEVTSPQAFEGLRTSGRKVHAPEKTLAVVDHNVPTTEPLEFAESRTPKAPSRLKRWPTTRESSASNILMSSTSAKASSTSSVPSKALRCPAPRSSAATATPRRTVRSARWRTASGHPRSNTCSPHRR